VKVAIRTEAVTTANGAFRALENLDLEIRSGDVFRLHRPQRRRQSTTIRLLLDRLRPTSGRAEVLGADVRPEGDRGAPPSVLPRRGARCRHASAAAFTPGVQGTLRVPLEMACRAAR
jgi:ABC-type branched-subunit amino acid transport system ATPase component